MLLPLRLRHKSVLYIIMQKLPSLSDVFLLLLDILNLPPQSKSTTLQQTTLFTTISPSDNQNHGTCVFIGYEMLQPNNTSKSTGTKGPIIWPIITPKLTPPLIIVLFAQHSSETYLHPTKLLLNIHPTECLQVQYMFI